MADQLPPVTTEAGGLDLDMLRARLENATPGPWDHDARRVLRRRGSAVWTIATTPALSDEGLVGLRSIPDAEFIAAARTDVPALLAEVQRLRGELAEAEAVVSDVTEQLTGRALMAAELVVLRAQRQAVLDLCVNGGDWKDDGCYWLRADAVLVALGASS